MEQTAMPVRLPGSGVGQAIRGGFAGGWVFGALASVLALERLAYLAAKPLARDGPLGSVTLRLDRPHGVDALVAVLGRHAGSSLLFRAG
jgi:hypothetical protein